MFRMLIATPLHYLGVVFKDFYFRSGVLLSISNNYNKYVTRKLIRKKTWLVAHIHRTDSYVRILFMCFCLFRRAASMLSLFFLFVCLFFSYPICVDIDEVLWPFRLCLCFRSWNVRIVSPDMRWQWKGKKKKKKFHRYPFVIFWTFPIVTAVFHWMSKAISSVFLFACLRLVISLTNSASFSQPMRCTATNSADSPMCAARSHFCYFSFPISRTL